MRSLRAGTSFWLDQSRRTTPVRKLRRDCDADVAIVGGGITGCACAYLLAKSGARVGLLEARHIGRGSTAATYVIATPRLPARPASQRRPRRRDVVGHDRPYHYARWMTFGFSRRRS